MAAPSLFPNGSLPQDGVRLVDGPRQVVQPEPTPVSEPGSLALFGVSLALVGGILLTTAARRRRVVRSAHPRRMDGAA